MIDYKPALITQSLQNLYSELKKTQIGLPLVGTNHTKDKI